jgi:hypothetical protein
MTTKYLLFNSSIDTRTANLLSSAIVDCINADGIDDITIGMCSSGGNVTEGVGLHHVIRSCPKPITIFARALTCAQAALSESGGGCGDCWTRWIEARVRTPALLRRLSSFSSADWIPHANCTSWGCLGLTRGDRYDRSQNCSRIPQTGVDVLAIASMVARRLRPRSFAALRFDLSPR